MSKPKGCDGKSKIRSKGKGKGLGRGKGRGPLGRPKPVVVSAVAIDFSATVTRAIDNVTVVGSGAGTSFT